jgi:MATE family multidrug resistance protein
VSDPTAARAPASSLGTILAQAWPMLVAQLAFILNASIDTAMAGRVSAAQLAGVSLGVNLYVTIAIGLMGALTALGPIAAQHLGAGRAEQVGRDVRQALWMAAFLSLPGCAALVFHRPWIQLAHPQGDVAQVADAYLSAIAFGLPASLGTWVFVTLNSAVSRPKFTMAINVTALLLKIPLNALFIWGAGPVPALGGAGCAVASVLQSWLTLGLGLAFWLGHPCFAAFRRDSGPRIALPRWPLQKELITIGVPTGLSAVFEVASFTLMAVLLARLGADTLSGHQIVANVVAILYMVPMANGFAAGALVGQAVGARDARHARQVALHAVQLAGAASISMALFTWLARGPIIAAYTTDPQIAAAAHRLIGLAAAFHAFDGLQNVSVAVLRGYKVTLAPMIIYGISLWGIGLGGGYWLAYQGLPGVPPLGAIGVWAAALAGLAVAAVSLVALARTVSVRFADPQPTAPA